MKVFVAGATGVIGCPLIKSLTLAGHTTFGMVRSQSLSASLSDSGAEPVIADALDGPSVRAAVAKVRPDVIINELTTLPKHYTPTEMKAAAERDARVRLEGNKNLIAAAQQTGVRRFLVRSTGFWYAPSESLAEEGERLAYGASPGVATGAQRYAELEAITLGRTEFEASPSATDSSTDPAPGSYPTAIWENRCVSSKCRSSATDRESGAGYTLTMPPTPRSEPWIVRPALTTSWMTIPASSACG
jgi:hypothetical protein